MVSTYSFDKDKFANLLSKAIGDRSINQYALHSGVSATYISKLLRGLVENPPMPPTIQKLAEKSYGITYEELMEAAGHVSEPSKIDLVDALEDKETQLLAAGQPITMAQRLGIARILDNPSAVQFTKIPILGQIKMGVPILAQDNWEGELEIPPDIRADFALEARGDSMIGVGLLDGDYAICREASTASSGDIVVGLREDGGYSEATLKFYFNGKEASVLRAANPSVPDIPMDGDWRIGGVLVGILRKDSPTYRVYNSYLAARDVSEDKWVPVFEKASQLGIKPEQVMNMIETMYQVMKGGN
ncbi:helix-turn-helix domain-containing protein [Desulforamulus aquiferis]|uniref:S24 family peptidase n=1 Tax=Desulforamulus aquiferis TaxID=1397668 RepID=A0AAW7ZHE3_9FIRM|nr:S24 family peptidase [Desulforamulus aquiferis]MDO7789122.1 S24 family peptidase [Desulforamulus aquiferis]